MQANNATWEGFPHSVVYHTCIESDIPPLTSRELSTLYFSLALSCFTLTLIVFSMNRPDCKLRYEAPSTESFELSATPLNICIQFSGEAGFEDFEEGEAL